MTVTPSRLAPSELKAHHIGNPIEVIENETGKTVAVGLLQGYMKSVGSFIYLQGIRDGAPAHDSLHTVIVHHS